MGLWETVSAGCSCNSRARVQIDRMTASLTTKIPVYEAQTTRAREGESEGAGGERHGTRKDKCPDLEKRTLTHHSLSIQNTQGSIG